MIALATPRGIAAPAPDRAPDRTHDADAGTTAVTAVTGRAARHAVRTARRTARALRGDAIRARERAPADAIPDVVIAAMTAEWIAETLEALVAHAAALEAQVRALSRR